MKRLFVCLAMLALSVPAFAADVARNEDIYIEGVPGSFTDDYGRGNALVASMLDGTFTDVGPFFRTALDAAGMSTDIIYDPHGAWPPMDDYLTVLVSSADMWWPYDWAPDEAVLSSYMAGGGTCMLVGQDYLYSRGGFTGFPMDWLGVCGGNFDLNWDAMYLYTEGADGGPIPGLMIDIVACYGANLFFTDEIDPCDTGLAWWTSEQVTFPVEGGCSTPVSIFSTIGYGCAAQADINTLINDWLHWLQIATPAEQTTWGSVKGIFR
jgi:hypothetical protein